MILYTQIPPVGDMHTCIFELVLRLKSGSVAYKKNLVLEL